MYTRFYTIRPIKVFLQPVYLSISDDATEEKLNPTSLQADWLAPQPDDLDIFSSNDLDLFSHDAISLKRCRESDLDSDSSDLDDVITSSADAQRLIELRLEKFERLRAEGL